MENNTHTHTWALLRNICIINSLNSCQNQKGGQKRTKLRKKDDKSGQRRTTWWPEISYISLNPQSNRFADADTLAKDFSV